MNDFAALSAERAEDFFAQVSPEEHFIEEAFHQEMEAPLKPYAAWLNEFFTGSVFSRELLVDRTFSQEVSTCFREGVDPSSARVRMSSMLNEEDTRARRLSALRAFHPSSN